MPKQTGDFPLIGSFGDFVFYKTKHGNLVRRKGNLNKERVSTEAVFEGSRKASSEFGRAASASGLLRNEFKKHCPYAGDGETHARLSKLLGDIIRADTKHAKGERLILAENIGPLKTFEWVREYPLSRSLWVQCGGSLGADGVLTITMPNLQPKRDLGWPLQATHAEIKVVGIAADFPNKKVSSAVATTGLLMKSNVTISKTLECPLPQEEGLILMAGIGVQFFEDKAGKMESLIEGASFGVVG
ncbi:MAG: hypothetical protein JST27_00680 [Bacteroidetes bacterium]|nr:hypothetical protein [Bacteroidota bacterium]